jgi:hypothetical protein
MTLYGRRQWACQVADKMLTIVSYEYVIAEIKEWSPCHFDEQ